MRFGSGPRTANLALAAGEAERLVRVREKWIMGLFEDAQRAKAERDAVQRNEAASAAEAAGRAEATRATKAETQSRLLREFVAGMNRLGIAPAKHRCGTTNQGIGGTVVDPPRVKKRVAVTGWSLSGCRGCDGGMSSCYYLVVGPDALLYGPRSQPRGMFKSPVPTSGPVDDLEALEAQLTHTLSKFL
jgi:hypothetical protein